MAKKELVDPSGAKQFAAYSPGLSIGDMVFVSGQAAIDSDTGEVLADNIEEQTEITLRRVEEVLKAAGCTLDDVVKSTVHVTDLAEFGRFNDTYKKFFSDPLPTRTTVQSGLYSTLKVEIDVIAIRGCSK